MAAVDAVIVTYGGGHNLASSVAAVRGQVRRVLIIDNASPDDTASQGEAIAGVEVVRNPTNIGYAAAMNQSLERSDAPFLLSLNADCVLADGYVEACLAEMADERVAGVTGVLRLPDGRIDSTGISLTKTFRAVDRDRHAAQPSTAEPFGVSGAAALWRRSALDSQGARPWWEWLFVYWDDVELCWRLGEAGWRFRCALSANAVHQRGSDTADPDFIEGQSLRNRLAVVARHKGTAALAPTLPTIGRLALRHRLALKRAEPLAAARVGLAQRKADRRGI